MACQLLRGNMINVGRMAYEVKLWSDIARPDNLWEDKELEMKFNIKLYFNFHPTLVLEYTVCLPIVNRYIDIEIKSCTC